MMYNQGRECDKNYPTASFKTTRPPKTYSTVTLFARFLGWSTSVPLSTAT